MKTLQLLSLVMAGAAAIAVPAPIAVAQGGGRAASALVVTAQNVTAIAGGRADQSIAQPGDEIRYRLVFTNVTAGPVKNVQFVDPIPGGMVYVLGSATSDNRVRAEYSIDGGKGYAAQPLISVVADGKQAQKPASAEQYTHVRWTVVGSLARGAQVTVEFRGRVKEAPAR
jgi:uncharacterized repeat protein (TIGR01451 family)